jgi:hypothetical protein
MLRRAFSAFLVAIFCRLTRLNVSAATTITSRNSCADRVALSDAVAAAAKGPLPRLRATAVVMATMADAPVTTRLSNRRAAQARAGTASANPRDHRLKSVASRWAATEASAQIGQVRGWVNRKMPITNPADSQMVIPEPLVVVVTANPSQSRDVYSTT